MNQTPDTRLKARYLARESSGLVILAAALFWSAGSLRWAAGWAAWAATAAWAIATAVVVLFVHPALLAERLGPRRGAKSWDTAILGLLGLAQLARSILAGLDQRLGWPGDFAPAVQGAGLLLALAGFALTVWATASNAYFSQVVRIQGERGHAVASGGPYGGVRHPGYSGAIVAEMGLGLLLDSWWGLLAAALGVALLVARTALEDQTLRRELAGYAAYAARTRFRLLPGVW